MFRLLVRAESRVPTIFEIPTIRSNNGRETTTHNVAARYRNLHEIDSVISDIVEVQNLYGLSFEVAAFREDLDEQGHGHLVQIFFEPVKEEKWTHVQIATSSMTTDPLHPEGRCQCPIDAAGACLYCRSHCVGCGLALGYLASTNDGAECTACAARRGGDGVPFNKREAPTDPAPPETAPENTKPSDDDPDMWF